MKITQDGFDILRHTFGKLSQLQVDGINFLVSVLDEDGAITSAQAAYILATAWHETAK
ncbi:hypothetical protein MMP74_17775 [Acinetobacter sp. NIPH 1869]|nr:hypothetical protein [Acinetobacter higginsii]MCH7306201.1 hypothetical protein [Acinetobacter higginsii]